MADTLNLVVLFSGKGSNLHVLIERFHGRRIAEKSVRVVPVTNRPEAGGILLAKNAGIDTVVIDHRRYPSREAFDEKLVETIESYDPVLVVMAGFMRILTPVFTSRIEAINLHPSLLPLFKGADAISQSFRSGMKVGGVTIHRVTQELDSGEILAQSCLPIDPDDTLQSYTEKIQALEHRLLPDTVDKLLRQKVR